MRICLPLVLFALVALSLPATALSNEATQDGFPGTDRSPVDVLLSEQGWLVTVNQTSHTVSLLRTSDGKVLDEVAVGRRPAAAALCPDGRTILVTGSRSAELAAVEVAAEKLKPLWRIRVGVEPFGVAVSPDGRRAFVALTAEDKLAVVDLERREVIKKITVRRWPRYLALSQDGSRLAVGCSGDGGVATIDTGRLEVVRFDAFRALNLGHMQFDAAGHVYFPWTLYGGNPTRSGDIRRGWVLANKLGRIAADGKGVYRRGMSLDPRGRALGDPLGVRLSDDGEFLAVTGSGTGELAGFHLPNTPLIEISGGDHMDFRLARDPARFFRIPLGGRPMGLKIARDNQTAFVANYLENAVQVVDLKTRKLTRTLSLGAAKSPSLARRGEVIFHDARRSFEGWYSCHTCHYEGGGNSETMDTLNDGSSFSYKTVLPLFNVSRTAPWTWHGWQTDLSAAMHKSLTSTMAGPKASDDDVTALLAYIKDLQPPPNPHRLIDGSLSEAARRGREVFASDAAGCIQCHSGPTFTDGEIHEVGLTKKSDRYRGFNTPTLLGVYRKNRLLHDGRARSLEELLKGDHDPAKVSGGLLSEQQRRDLIEYLKSL